MHKFWMVLSRIFHILCSVATHGSMDVIMSTFKILLAVLCHFCTWGNIHLELASGMSAVVTSILQSFKHGMFDFHVCDSVILTNTKWVNIFEKLGHFRVDDTQEGAVPLIHVRVYCP